MMKTILFFIALIFSQASYAQSLCEKMTGANGKAKSTQQLINDGLIESGGWQTDDVNEFQDFPKDVRRAVKSFVRRHKIPLVEFFWELGFVNKLTPNSKFKNAYLVGIETSPNSNSLVLTASIIDLSSGKSKELLRIVNDELSCNSKLAAVAPPGPPTDGYVNNVTHPAPSNLLEVGAEEAAKKLWITKDKILRAFLTEWAYVPEYDDDQHIEFLFQDATRFCRIQVGSVSATVGYSLCRLKTVSSRL